ncbi:hypothetical protein COK55_06955 [Bacillus cereus]|nr:hypothetical protein COK55_06955 [Bacillus cereus]
MEEKERREVTDGDEEQLEEIELKDTKKQEVLDDIKENAENVGQEKADTLIEVIIRANEKHADFMRQMAVAGERFARVIAPITQQMENHMQAMSSVYDSIGVIGQRLQDTLNTFDFYDSLSNVRELAQRHEEATLKFKTIMIELGFPPHDSMPVNITGHVIRLYEEKGVEYTGRFLERYMCMFVYNKETLTEMHNSWQQVEWLEKRLPIISTVIEGHFNGYYMLTVPAILAQIEGVLVEGILKLEAVAPDEQIKFRHQKNFLGQFLLGDKGSFSFDEQIEEFYLNTVLVNFDRGKEVESDLSRHAILHGEDVNYGTKINSLKGILIFDYLFDKLNEAYKDIEESKLEVKRKKEIAQSKKRARNASGKKPKGYRKTGNG